MRLITRLACIALLLTATPLSAQSHAGAAGPALTGFGLSVAVGENEVLVGEPNNTFRPGAVYVYRKTGTAWRQAGKLVSPDSAIGDRFGAALAIAGPVLFVGSTQGPGRVYTFRKEGTTWRPAGIITAADLNSGDGFGSVLAASGDWLFVAAPQQAAVISGTTTARTGAVYVFRRGAGGEWSQLTKLVTSDPKANDGFGTSLAANDTRAVVGAPGKNERLGMAYVYQLDSTGTWQETMKLVRPTLQRGDAFGTVVRLVGDDALLVSAPFSDGGYGALFAFRWDARRNQWNERGRLTGTGNPRQERFPGSVAVSGAQVWVGSPFSLPAGRIQAFTVDTSRMPVSPRALAGSEEAIDRFGQVIAVNGNVGAVAAPGADVGGGNVAIFERSSTGDWRSAGVMVAAIDALDPITGGEKKCSPEGKVSIFSCKETDLRGFLPVTKLTTQGRTSHLSGNWGWTDPQTNREYALLGRTDGTAFVDVTDPVNPVFVGDLPKPAHTVRNSWREIKTYKNHAYVVSEGQGHGMQVFDLTQLRQARRGAAPVTYKPTAWYDRVSSSHNIVINEESGYAYIVGAGQASQDACGGAMHIVDIREPAKPSFVGCFADSLTGRARTGYIHDAQCVMYGGPDTRYAGREICITANETAISIQDLTDKKAPRVLGRASHTNVGYSHQGWFTGDQRYWFMNDELDEVSGNAMLTRTIVWDLNDLEKPSFTEFSGTTGASDHNLYIKGNLMYQSNYAAGLRIIDVSDPLKPVEVGYFDTAPYSDNVAGFDGSWSNYPFFASGTIVVSSGNEGVFLLKKSEKLTP